MVRYGIFWSDQLYIILSFFFPVFSVKRHPKSSFKQNLYFVFWSAWSRKLTLIRNSVNFASQFRTDILYCDSCLQIGWMIETLAHIVSLFPWPIILGTYKHDIPRRLRELYELWTIRNCKEVMHLRDFLPNISPERSRKVKFKSAAKSVFYTNYRYFKIKSREKLSNLNWTSGM